MLVFRIILMQFLSLFSLHKLVDFETKYDKSTCQSFW